MSYGQAYAVEAEAKYDTEYQVVGTKAKKPGFFKRWLFNSLKEAAKAEQQTNQLNESIKVRRGPQATLNGGSDIDLNKERAIRFNVYIANGGRVVETSRYDRIKDRHTNGLYIISDQQDFGREIDKIIVMEGLK